MQGVTAFPRAALRLQKTRSAWLHGVLSYHDSSHAGGRMIERTVGNLACTHLREGLYKQSTWSKCGRHAQWIVDGEILCWQHAEPLLAGRDDEIAAALEAEGERREAETERLITHGRPGLIYVVQPYGMTPAPLKIGFTRDLEALKTRLGHLQVSHWTQLEVVCLRQATFPAEQDLHRRLREHWIRGEWFRAHPDVMRAVHAVGSAVEMAA